MPSFKDVTPVSAGYPSIINPDHVASLEERPADNVGPITRLSGGGTSFMDVRGAVEDIRTLLES